LESEYNAQIIGAVNNNVFAWVGEVRTSLITHKYPLIAPLVETDEVKMASLDDIAAMKLHAIFTSGQRSKDFADMYYLLEHRSLNDVSRLYDLKYPGTSLVKAKESIRYFHYIMDDEPNMLLRPFNKKDIENRMLMATLEPNKVFMKTIKAEKKIDINEDISKNKNQSRGRSL
jgi:hypothetical protein